MRSHARRRERGDALERCGDEGGSAWCTVSAAVWRITWEERRSREEVEAGLRLLGCAAGVCAQSCSAHAMRMVLS